MGNSCWSTSLVLRLIPIKMQIFIELFCWLVGWLLMMMMVTCELPQQPHSTITRALSFSGPFRHDRCQNESANQHSVQHCSSAIHVVADVVVAQVLAWIPPSTKTLVYANLILWEYLARNQRMQVWEKWMQNEIKLMIFHVHLHVLLLFVVVF